MFSFSAILPEIFVLVMACSILLLDLFVIENRIAIYRLAQLTLIGAFALTVPLFDKIPLLAFSGHFMLDNLALTLKLGAYVLTFFVFLYAYDYLRLQHIKLGEFYVLGLFSLLGMMVLTSAGSLLTVYLGLELLSLPLYAMVTLLRDSKLTSEAAMKYFVMGALASGMLLYGISLMYGMTGELILMHVAEASIGMNLVNQSIMGLGIALIVVGIAFKLGAVPFHMWIPDVYSGATTATVLFIASTSKLAAFALAVRLLFNTFGVFFEEWQPMLLILGVLSLIVGNVVALVQTNIKRLLAYSTIAHMGFVLLALASGSLGAGLFYILTYGLMAVAGFAVVIALSRAGYEAQEISDLKGLNRSHPWFAFLIMLLMFSLAGVPPLVGFYAKFVVLDAMIKAGLTPFAIIAVILSVVGAFYYLRIIKVMYFDTSDAQALPQFTPNKPMRVALSINSLAFLALGLFPGMLLSYCFWVFA